MNFAKREICGECVYEATHESGLRVLVCPKKDYSSCYAMFGTAYGSVDTTFCREGEEPITVPHGIAHFLEHKMFEQPNGGTAFELFAKTGASANAFTSFDKTCYLFSTSGDLVPSLEILLKFVQEPYFTPENVAKEQGIIGQEIKMCEDSAGRRVLWNLLRAMYHRHPVQIEIAGTVESIAKIDAPLLYRCYETFYQPKNMALCVTGNCSPEAVADAVERLVCKKTVPPVTRMTQEEPESVVHSKTEETFAVSVPMFYLGFKDICKTARKTAREQAEAEVLLELLASTCSDLYQRLEQKGLINPNFGADYMCGFGYALSVFGGEGMNPEAVQAEICAELARLQREGIDEEAFECAKRSVYMNRMVQLENVSAEARFLMNATLSGYAPEELLQTVQEITTEDLMRRLPEMLNPERMTLSVLRPNTEKGE